MRRMGVFVVLTLLLTITAVYAQTEKPVQTGDPTKRGLKESDFPRSKQLVPGVYSYEALRNGDPGGFMTTVSLFVVTTDGVLVADGQGSVAETKKMVDAIAKITPQPIKYVVIGSDHGDHTAGNSAFPSSAVFIASPASKKIMEEAAANAAQRGARGGNAAPATPAPLPTETVADKRTIKMGNTEIEILNLGRAHTGGDLSVYVPNGKVLFMSEAYLHRIFPAMRSAYPSEWLATIKKAQALNATWYIPGHGFVDDAPSLKTELEEYRKALEHVVKESKRLHDAKVACPVPQNTGGGGRGARGEGPPQQPPPKCEAAQKANWGPYADWTLRGGQEETAIRRVYDELDGKLK
jgi:glyoxylase-like metal-dependent hydrolase (beta-lactamase superfamily II)